MRDDVAGAGLLSARAAASARAAGRGAHLARHGHPGSGAGWLLTEIIC
jgi:hypothetical protein